MLATLLATTVGAIVSISFALTATRRADALERASYISGIAAANSAIQQHDYTTAASYLDRVPAKHRGWEYHYLRAALVHHESDWQFTYRSSSARRWSSTGRAPERSR